jgi:Na+/proline symporter
VLSESSSQAVEHGPGGWLRERRTRLALWIAAVEGIVVWISRDVSKWAVIVLAAVAVFAFAYRRNSESNFVRHALWIFAASQLLALLLVLFAVVVKWLVIVGLVVFAVVGLAILLFDRR